MFNKIKNKYYSNDCILIFIGLILFICNFIFFIYILVSIKNNTYVK